VLFFILKFIALLGLIDLEGQRRKKKMDLQTVQEFLTQDSPEVKEYLQGLKTLTLDETKNLVTTNEELKKWFESEKHSYFDKNINTWKSNNLEKMITEEIKKRNPEKSLEQIELEKLRAEFEAAQKQLALKGVKEKATSVASQKGIPLEILDFFVNEDEETTNNNLSTFETVMEKYITAKVDERLKGSYQPPAGSGTGKTFTLDAIKNMSPDEINKNWDSISKVLNQK
jgi:hypothetical protein